MRLVDSVFAALIGICSVTANAQQWPLEPAAVLGVKLGQPIAASALPRCNSVDAKEQEPCLEKQGGLEEAPAQFGLLRHPFPYAQFTVLVDEAGLVANVVVTLDQKNFSEFAQVLTERYGTPTNAGVVQRQNISGGRFSSAELEWKGKKVSIMAMERSHRVDRSVVAFMDVAAVARELQKKNEKSKGAASKL